MTSHEPPRGFMDLAAASNAFPNTICNLMGMVVDVMPPKKTSSRDYMMSFKLLDRRLSDGDYQSKGLLVRFFRSDLESLPHVRNIGDVVILRGIKLSEYQSQRVALSSWRTVVLVFERDAIPRPAFTITIQSNQNLPCLGLAPEVKRVTKEEQLYAIDMKDALKTRLASILAQQPIDGPRASDLDVVRPLAKIMKGPPRFSLKYQRVEELQEGRFADVIGEVVKCIHVQFGCDLYISDYTSNKNLRYYAPPEEEAASSRDGDAYAYTNQPKKAWPGPFGHLVLKLNLKPPHAGWASENIKDGDFVLARNVKMKVKDPSNWLEGDMWPDDQTPDKVQLKKLRAPDVQEVVALLERKQKYSSARPPTKENDRPGKSLPKQARAKISKADRKRLKKLRQKEERGARNSRKEHEESEAEDSGRDSDADVRRDINPHIRCWRDDVAVMTLRDILDPDDQRHTNERPSGQTYKLPFINANYRAKVRVVDFEPQDLAEFSFPAEPGEEREEEDHDSESMDLDSDATQKHEWHFALLLEDATKPPAATGEAERTRMWVQVHHEDAQFLLGNSMDDPSNLRYASALLAKLRERLFVLWGNLQEKKKDDELNNLPFECCIMEYGIPLEKDDPERELVPFGWKRLYALFGTTIQS